ncbi:MAG: hypothetical protein WKF88_09315 [Ferruginibacter sp.]
MYNETFLMLSLFCALFIFMVDYGIGHPADDKVGYGSLLFSYSFFWAVRRMRNAGLYGNYYGQYMSQLSNAANDLEKHRIRKSFQELIYTEGREMFSWEKTLGMCPYCTHFWFSVFSFGMVNIFCQKENIFIFGFYFVLSHFFIRALKKYF